MSVDLPDLKQLKAIISLCRKTGVDTIEIAGIKITLKDQVIVKPTRRKSPAVEAKAFTSTSSSELPETEEELTEEQLLNWSVFNPPEAPKEDA